MTSDNDQGQPELQHSKSLPEAILPTRQALAEALDLSAEVLRNIELSEVPLVNIALKASRLARLLNEFDLQRVFEYEAGGYPTTPTGVSPGVWRLAVAAGRSSQQLDFNTKEQKDYAYLESIGELEAQIRLAEAALAAARDPDVSISSANPYQHVAPPIGNRLERDSLRGSVAQATRRLASRRALIYQYASLKHYELKFSGIADDVFTRIRGRVDASIGRFVPGAVHRLIAVYENLRSENPEDWSNAVHSCRRLLQDVANAVFPSTDATHQKLVNGKQITIRLGADQYVNRIVAFVENASNSDRFKAVVGSHLQFLGDRLDSVFEAAQKGSHSTIVTREEADRYVVFTYLLVGDILSLVEQSVDHASPA